MSQQEMPSLNYGPLSQAQLDAFINVVPSSTTTLTTNGWNTATSTADPNYWQYQIKVPNNPLNNNNLGGFMPQSIPPPNFNTVPYKSPFEEILDILFNQVEKIEYLKSIGYEVIDNFTVRRAIGENSIQENAEFAFLREISVKFKNLLISKPTLKMKI